MRIGLISDTHMPWEQKEFSPQVEQIFRGVDLILHGGDIYSHVVLDDLEKIAPVLAAQGDDDYPGDDPRVKEKHFLRLEGHNVLLIHEGPPISFDREQLEMWWRNRQDKGEDLPLPDVIVSGHEHRDLLERKNGVLYVSSGSPNLLHYKRGPGTLAILELEPGCAEAEIIHLKEEPPVSG